MDSDESGLASESPLPDSTSKAQADDVSFGTFARETARYAHAFGQFVVAEAALAKVNLVRLLVCALLVPPLALGILLGLDALLAALIYHWMTDWSLAIVGVVLINIALLLALFAFLRRWWRSLSLPRSRAELSRFVKELR